MSELCSGVKSYFGTSAHPLDLITAVLGWESTNRMSARPTLVTVWMSNSAILSIDELSFSFFNGSCHVF